MRMYLCIYVFVCIYIYMYVYVRMFTAKKIWEMSETSLWRTVYEVCVCADVRMYVYININTYTYIYMYVSILLRKLMGMCQRHLYGALYMRCGCVWM